MKTQIKRHKNTVQVIVTKQLDKPNNSGLPHVRQIVAEFHGGEEAEERAKWFVDQMEGRG